MRLYLQVLAYSSYGCPVLALLWMGWMKISQGDWFAEFSLPVLLLLIAGASYWQYRSNHGEKLFYWF